MTEHWLCSTAPGSWADWWGVLITVYGGVSFTLGYVTSVVAVRR